MTRRTEKTQPTHETALSLLLQGELRPPLTKEELLRRAGAPESARMAADILGVHEELVYPGEHSGRYIRIRVSIDNGRITSVRY